VDPVAMKKAVDLAEEGVEELFGQLWVILKLEARIPPNTSHGG
jgi:hypothetical protein